MSDKDMVEKLKAIIEDLTRQLNFYENEFKLIEEEKGETESMIE